MTARVKYALEARGDKRLELSWEGIWRDMHVVLDGQLIGIIKDQQALLAGQEFQLPDQGTLKIQLVRGFLSFDLRILRNGRSIPGTAAHPKSILNAAGIAAFLVAGFNLIVGLYVILFSGKTTLVAGIGPLLVLVGLIFLLVGYFIRAGSLAALILSIAFLAVNAALQLVQVILTGSSTNIIALGVNICLLIPMLRGLGAARTLKQYSN